MNKLTRFFCVSLLSLGAMPLWAQNTKKTVSQVTTTVDVTDDVDYIISGATPFGDAGVVNLVNTEHAVLIVNQMRPSALINQLAAHVKINGEKAVDGTNCQVKLYNLGAIVLPYGSDFKPLTVYSEQNFSGESVNNFGTENSGGYMNTLSAAKLNNKIRSFKLKRGYMVTFSTQPSGRGYSRCFIAADKDVEMAELPMILDKTISSYRVFKWYDAGKKQLANYMNKEALTALNVQSSYDWGQGNSSFLPDFEWVPNHIYEDWPSSATIGGTSQSPHTKNNNEPRNKSDDTPQDLATILGNWENMMRTGMRLCSPSSWDGSDYWDATGFLADFLDSIDARGWRCDIIDLHCYWHENNFGNVRNWANKYHRPIWISEWCWGASWDGNGAFADGVTKTDVKNALQRICSNLNSWDCVERYFYWNNEREISRLYTGGSLTPAGEYYASMNSGLGYNGKYDFVPKNPRQYSPSNCATSVKSGAFVITWHDDNGEFNKLMQLQRKEVDGTWETIADITPNEGPSNYTYTDDKLGNFVYRVRIIDVNNKERFSNETYTSVPAGSSTVQYGSIKFNRIANTPGVPFISTFDQNPMVFTGLMSYNSAKNGPVTVPYFSRTAITAQQMTIGLSPWLKQTTGGSEFTKMEEMPYLIIPEGHYSNNGVDVEVGGVSTGLRKGVEMDVTFSQPFPEGVTPVVIATINRAPSTNAMMHKIWNVTNTGFKCSVSYEEAVTNNFASPMLAYMAVTPGVACIDTDNKIYIAAGIAENTLYGTSPRPITFDVGTETLKLVDPFVFVDLQTKNTPVPTELKAGLKSQTSIDNVRYQTGVRVYRLTDKSVTTTNVDGEAQADQAGWVTIFKERWLDPDAIFTLQSSYKQQLEVRVANRCITVPGVANPDIFTASGARVLPYTVLNPGIYFVHANGRVAKVLVK